MATMPTREGVVPQEVARAFSAGLFDLPPPRPLTATSSSQTRWYVPVLMIGFQDVPLTHTPAEFEHALFDTTGSNPNGSVYDYYQWVSGGRLRVTGRVVAAVTMPQDKIYYTYNSYGLAKESTPQNLYGLARDALGQCSSTIDWSPFDQDHDGMVDILWVLSAGIGGENTPDRNNFWSITTSMSAGWHFGGVYVTSELIPGTAGQFYKIDRFSSVPECSALIPGHQAEIGVFCHEFGHALGLPDLYDTSGIPFGVGNYGPGNWSLMSTGGYGGSGLTPERPAHMGAWCASYLGWIQTFRPTQDGPQTLGPIEEGNPAMEMWFQGESHPEHFLVENRQQEGFDAALPSSGLLVTHLDDGTISSLLSANRVNSGLTPGLQIVEADGDYAMWIGQNRGQGSDLFPGTTGRSGIGDETIPNLRTFAGARTNLALGGIHAVGSNMQVQVQVNMPGWQPERSITSPTPILIDGARPGHWAVTDRERRVFAVRSELRNGLPQIVLYSRLAGVWQLPEVISATTVAALDPTIAVLPGGDLAVCWTDGRNGRLQIYYRARIRGQWTPEAAVATSSGDSHHSAIGADSKGMVELAYLNDQGSSRQVLFQRFSYLSPFGAAAPVTFPGEQPDPPALTVGPSGASYIVWSDRSTSPQRLYFARFTPDSGVSSRNPLTPTPAGPQLAVATVMDGAGNLHTLWQVGGSNTNELHYQRRRASSTPFPQDTTLDNSSGVLQGITAACDDSLDIHVAFEDWGGPTSRIRYKRWTPAGGWEFGGAYISSSSLTSTQPIVLPNAPGDVTLLYVTSDGDLYTLEARSRLFGASATAQVPVSLSPLADGLEVGPNPVRAGFPLRFAGRATVADRLEVFDVEGRRVASLPVRSAGGRFEAQIDPAVTRSWRGGVYFAALRASRERIRFVVLR